MYFNPKAFVDNLGYMGLGMLGIFIVIAVIMLSVVVLNKTTSDGDSRKIYFVAGLTALILAVVVTATAVLVEKPEADGSAAETETASVTDLDEETGAPSESNK